MIFIGGYARTGTTMMQGIICNDPETIGVTRECSYLRMLVAAYEYGKRIWSIHTEDYFDTPETFASFNRSLIDSYFAEVRKRFGENLRIVQKEPTLTLFFPEVFELYPHSVFIVMVRDPRDAIASQIVRGMKAVGSGYQRNVNLLLRDYLQRYQRIIQHFPQFNGRCCYIRYEDLVTDTETALHPLRQLTGLTLPWSPQGQRWETTRTAGEESSSALDGKPPSSSSIGKFRETLTSEEAARIRAHAQPLESHFGMPLFNDA